MDIHLNSSLNLEEVARLHQADLRVQGKYGVSYQRYWVNEEMGTVFCLMEGPDKESCEAVHRESHGELACNIIEVPPQDYKHYLSQFDHHVRDRVFTNKSKPDTGFRIFTHLNLLSASHDQYLQFLKIVHRYNKEFKGTTVHHTGKGIPCIFTSGLAAIQFVLAMQNEVDKTFNKAKENGSSGVELSIGLSAGDPVGEHSDQFFSGALSLAKRLSEVTKSGQIMISKTVRDCLINESSNDSYLQVVRIVDFPEEIFLTKLMKVTDDNLGFNDFNVQSLGRHIGLSRPQLYRKISRLTGLSPALFIREQRLRNAVSLIRNKSGNISEIALEVGYNSPSYFSKCFQERFGLLPSNL